MYVYSPRHSLETLINGLETLTEELIEAHRAEDTVWQDALNHDIRAVLDLIEQRRK